MVARQSKWILLSTDFFADLSERKEIIHWKGTSGARCCMDCPNLMRIGQKSPGDIGLECADRAQFVEIDDAFIWDVVDRLAALHGTIGDTDFKARQTSAGYTHEPEGLLQDQELRSTYGPSRHHLRDWMHTLVGDGVGNSHIGALLHTLKRDKITTDMLRDFAK